jgi:hypothetical protein
MYPVEAYKEFLIFTIIILCVGLTFLAVRWPQGINATFSQHAAAQKKTMRYYFALFFVALPLLSLFFIFWFVPTFKLPIWFTVCALASELFQHSVTCIPETGGWRTRWHVLLTNCSAALLVPLLLFILWSPHISDASKKVVIVCLAVMAAIIVYFYIMRRANKLRYLLLLQIGYYGAFFVSILTATYRT